jgi:outer membrane protein insertion porin family
MAIIDTVANRIVLASQRRHGDLDRSTRKVIFGTDTAHMTESIRIAGTRYWLPIIGLLALFTGCKHLAPGLQLAPGISPLPNDPPSIADVGVHPSDPSLAAKPWSGGEDLDSSLWIAEGESSSASEGQPIAVAEQQDPASPRYIARQFPQTYTSPLPPSTQPVTTPPSVYQLPQGTTSIAPPTNYQPPPTYQPPTYQGQQVYQGAQPYQNAPGGFQGNAQPPMGTYVPPGGVQVAPAQPLPGSALPTASVPFYPGGPIADSLYGPQGVDPYFGAPTAPPVYIPNTREADLELTGVPARTGRIMFGGAVNSDAGVTGQVTIDERNFDITRWPTSFQDFASGTAFRGAGQTFRIEAVPGSVFKRYTISFADPNLFGYLPISLGVSGFLYDRRFRDYDEERLGGRVSLGYRVTPDLSLSAGLTGQNVKIHRPRITGVPALDEVLGDNDLYSGEFKLTHDTRDSPFQPSEGHFIELGYERAFGDFDYNRYEIENRNYLLLAQRVDGSGKQTLMYGTRVGFSGADTPLFENYFAGGYSTMRGFDFRGASPVEGGVQVGGRFQWLNTLEYMFPITADDAFRGVAFVDFGTVERNIEVNRENFRVAPGLGLRVAIPMLGPAPLAFDFAYPISRADGDERRIFSFYMSAVR